ncbi:hypothetical protein DSECCO2_66140 [anaerobic digester metagenome]|jgi:hypothetical protein
MIVIAGGLPVAPLLALFVVVLDDQRPGVAAMLAAVDTAGIPAGNRPDIRRTAYGAVEPLHNRYMSDIGDNNRVG